MNAILIFEISLSVAVYFFLLDIESDEDGLTVLFKMSIQFSDSHVLSSLFVCMAYRCGPCNITVRA